MIACNNDVEHIFSSSQSLVVFEAVAGQTYYLMVGAYESSLGGNLVLTVDPFDSFTVDLQVSPTGFFDEEGNAIIHGTLTCSRYAYEVGMGGTVERTIGHRVIVGTFETDMGSCQGETPWELVVRPENGSFRAGRVSVSIYVLAFDAVTNEGLEITDNVVVGLKKK